MPRDLLLHQRALFLRVKKGYSYNEIMAEIPVAKSTLSGWLSGIKLGEEQKKRIRGKQLERWSRNHNLGEWNRAKRQKEVSDIRVQAKKWVGSLTPREFFIAGIMLYWGEGHKVNTMVALSNADPLLISLMMRWFRECLDISEDRFRISIHYHKGQNFREIESFWSKVTNIPLEQFTSPFCKPPGTGHRKHYLQWGVCRIYVAKSANLLHQIMAWKDGLIYEKISGKQT